MTSRDSLAEGAVMIVKLFQVAGRDGDESCVCATRCSSRVLNNLSRNVSTMRFEFEEVVEVPA